MLRQATAICTLAFAAVASAIENQAQQLIIAGKTPQDKLTDTLRAAEIIPDILPSFTPMSNLTLTWPDTNVSTSLGNTLSPSLLQHSPNVQVLDYSDDTNIVYAGHSQLALTLTDPDAPSRDNPEWSQVCHWLVTFVPKRIAPRPGIPGKGIKWEVEHLVEYKPPGPPEGTGKHRYVAILLAPVNGTTEKLQLSAPEDRQRWGFEGERAGVREWAGENGMGVIGANFIYAEFDGK